MFIYRKKCLLILMGLVTLYADYNYFKDDDFGMNKILYDVSNADSNCISKINNDLNM